jgi:Na+/melibiose symporter-like transporter
MFFPPGYFSRVHASLGVFIVLVIVGTLAVGVDASDTELQIVGGTAFVIGIATMVLLLDRLERRQERDGRDR